jgi:hypothetical protein
METFCFVMKKKFKAKGTKDVKEKGSKVAIF